MVVGRRWTLRLAAWVVGLGFAATLPPACAANAEQAVMHEVEIGPPRALAHGEAFALVVETGSLAEGSVLTVRDAQGDILGSIAGSPLFPGPKKQIIALIREVEGETVVLRVEVIPSGEDGALRAPHGNELRSMELVPMEVDP